MNIAPKLSNEEYEQNFSELKPAFTKNQATAEANRCLYCFDSPCMKVCPTHIDIATFIKKIASDNVKGSAKTILQSNWIALTCAKACPVDVLCEGACVYNERGEKPIEIGRLQRYAIDWYFEHGMPKLFTPSPKNGKSIGIIGGGPAGLSCAAESALLGFDVTIYEAKETAGGLNLWGIAPYKVTREDAMNEVKLVESFGVKIKTKIQIGKDISISELEKKHDAIFIGVGLTNNVDLKIPGEDLKGVVHALEFIEKVTTRKWSSVDVGKHVAIIGAGNTAIDAATEAKRLGANEVAIIYRRSENEMPAYDFEFELAKNDGVLFMFQTAPKKIIGSNGVVESMECVKMKLSEPDESGRRKPEPIPHSEFTIPVDMVIKSVGYEVNEHFITQIPNLKLNKGNIHVNNETMQTSNPKYFAGGDCTSGGREVVNAAAEGKRAARGIGRMISHK
jgi:glutamate synthase (NADPH/NADH) small chain